MNSEPMLPRLTAKELANGASNSLFAEKTWVGSPMPWALDAEQVGLLEMLGRASLSFYKGIDLLYRKSWSGQSILRNRSFFAPWVAEYYDLGKPEWLIEHSRSASQRNCFPAVLRPDLLPTAEGISLVEWDSVPGGIGMTAQLEELYVISKEGRMINSFGNALAFAAKAWGGREARMVIAVSEESETYRPEMEWLAEKLRQRAFDIDVCSPNELKIRKNELCLGEKRVHLVYRFWELFDFEKVPLMRDLAKLVESGNLVVSPPMKHIQEEKLSLALFHHFRLQSFWEETMERKELELLRKMIPRTWILDPAKLPPGAHLDGPDLQGGRLKEWMELGYASKKERNLVIKASGFHETAWGARSVRVGDDLSSEDWSASLQSALMAFPKPISVLQEFRKPRQWVHPTFVTEEKIESMKGRLRLSPYYFVDGGNAKRVGALATFCPVDKKIIHGMRDGALMPCHS